MRPAAPFLAATLALHGALVAVLASGFGHPSDGPPKTPIAVVVLEPAPPAEAAAIAPAPVPAAAPARPHVAPAPRPKRAAHPRRPRPAGQTAPAARRAEPPGAPAVVDPGFPAPSASAGPRDAPPAAAGPATAAAKTAVSIPADYASANRKPDYPRLSRLAGEQGTVLLRVLVRVDGRAGEVQVKQSSGHPLLDEAALAAVRGWRFRPATLDGKPVEEWYLVPIPFKLQDD